MGLTLVSLIDRFRTVAQLPSLFTVLLAKSPAHPADDLTLECSRLKGNRLKCNRLRFSRLSL